LIDLGEGDHIDNLIDVYHAASEVDDNPRDLIERVADIHTMAEEGNQRNLTKQTNAMASGTCRPACLGGVDAGTALRSAVFDPLTSALGRYQRLLLAPDGNLTRIPFEALPTGDGRFLLDDYRLSYLATGRDVLRFAPRPYQSADVPVVVADPDFDLQAEIPTLPHPAGKPDFWYRWFGLSPRAVPEGRAGPTPTRASIARPWQATSVLDRTRSLISRQLQAGVASCRESFGFSRLPGTRLEGERVAARLGVAPWFAEAAVVSRVKAIRSPRVLHLATHGFFLSDRLRNARTHQWRSALIEGDGMPAPARPTLEDPLLRSGLALAGINTWLNGKRTLPDAEDGLLTAEDVCNLDLSNTELVVLSACQTGLGRIHTTEGVLGLRRAFLLAGAKGLIVSLWKVSDLATAILMDRFYENLLQGRMDRDEALHEAQRYTRDTTVGQIRQEWLTPLCIERLAGNSESGRAYLARLSSRPDDHRPFEHPFYWGAFIYQGDTAPLPATD
jgi:CHAT domain-containing protein